MSEEVPRLLAELEGVPEDQRAARVEEYMQRKELEHDIETTYGVNVTKDVSNGAPLTDIKQKPTVGADWSLAEIESMKRTLSEMPPEALRGIREIRRQGAHYGRFTNKGWQQVDTLGMHGAMETDGTIFIVGDENRMDERTPHASDVDWVAGHGFGNSVTGMDHVLAHELSHRLAKNNSKAVEAILGHAGFKELTRDEMLEIVPKMPLTKLRDLDELHEIGGARAGDSWYDFDPQSGKFVSYDVYKTPGSVEDPDANSKKWGRALDSRDEYFAELCAKGLHTPIQLHDDLVGRPARDAKHAGDEVEALVRKLPPEGQRSPEDQARLRDLQLRRDKLVAGATAKAEQFRILREDVFQVDRDEVKARANVIEERRGGAARERFEKDVAMAVTPDQVARVYEAHQLPFDGCGLLTRRAQVRSILLGLLEDVGRLSAGGSAVERSRT